MEALSATAPPHNLPFLRFDPGHRSSVHRPSKSRRRLSVKASPSKLRRDVCCSSTPASSSSAAAVVSENDQKTDLRQAETPIVAAAPLKRVSSESLQYESGFLGVVLVRTGEHVADTYLREILSSKVYDVAFDSPLQLAPKLSERWGVQVKIIGVEPSDANTMALSLHTGERVMLNQVGGFADGVTVKTVGEETFRMCRELVDGVVLVSRDAIYASIKGIWHGFIVDYLQLKSITVESVDDKMLVFLLVRCIAVLLVSIVCVNCLL